jgi:acetoacetate decarboxylase
VRQLKGFLFPRSASGRSSLIPPPPWHYSGDLLTVEFRTDPERVAELLPHPLEPVEDDPGAVAVIWADWQSCSDNSEELYDPVRSQYKECFVVVRCSWGGDVYSRCTHIWVDKDFALVRGYHQGYPKKLGEIHVTRPVAVGKAGPRLEAGGRFGATLTSAGRRIIEARFTIRESSEDAGFVNARPMLHNRWMPAIESDGRDSLDELVTMKGYDVELGPAWKGDAAIQFFESPVEELDRLTPIEMLGGYWRSVGTSWNGGRTLSDDFSAPEFQRSER